MENYENYLDDVEKKFKEFIFLARKVKPTDKSKKNSGALADAIKSNVEFRAMLQRFRNLGSPGNTGGWCKKVTS